MIKFLRVLFECSAVMLVAAVLIFFVHDTLRFQAGPGPALDEDAYRRILLYLVLALAGLTAGWLAFQHAELKRDRQIVDAVEAERVRKKEAARRP